MSTLPVSEIFHTIQGEGPAAGRAAWFVRFMGCNLSCSWCDSAYTWDAERYVLAQQRTPMTPTAILETITTPGVVVLTGGEPLMQQRKPAWPQLLELLGLLGHPIHLETNGTLLPDDNTLSAAELVVVSPKLANAGAHRKGQHPALHAEYARLADFPKVHLKIVCADHVDVERAVALAEAYGFPHERTWVMPEGTTTDALAGRWQRIAEHAAQLGVNATHRLHVLAWGDQRGH